MRVPKEILAAAADRAVARVDRVLGKKASGELAEVADAVLVKLGHDAERRQRRRAVKRSLKKAAKAAAVVGAGAAAVVAVRRAVRGRT